MGWGVGRGYPRPRRDVAAHATQDIWMAADNEASCVCVFLCVLLLSGCQATFCFTPAPETNDHRHQMLR